MLSADELGAFILVLANSQQNASLKAELHDALAEKYTALNNSFDSIRTTSAPDDVAVFEQLQMTDLDAIPVWQSKQIGHWQLVYNAMRQLRPARASTQTFHSIKQVFDDSRFHFNKPFLTPEILWQGEYQGTSLRVLYNKFPFSDYHLLIAVSPESDCSQELTEETHALIFGLVQDYGDVFPGFGVGFNSLAAGASVNHLHFQGFIHEQPFPIEHDCWQQNAGGLAYPLAVHRFSQPAEAWQYLDQLIADDCAFNCLYRASGCYVIPRVYQGTVALPEWLAGAGWLDVAGVITVSDENTFESLKENEITEALKRLDLPKTRNT